MNLFFPSAGRPLFFPSAGRPFGSKDGFLTKGCVVPHSAPGV